MLAAMGNVNPSHLFDKKLFARHDHEDARGDASVDGQDVREGAAEIISPAALLPRA
jgi:hypothetical protein